MYRVSSSVCWVLGRVDEILATVGGAAELEVIRYAA